MRITRIRISNFRVIKYAEIFPGVHNALLGPNNTGKTAVLEALNLLLNPEFTAYSHPIGENDFYHRDYLPGMHAEAAPAANAANLPATTPAVGATISVEAVITELNDQDEDQFRENLIPWDPEAKQIVASTEEGVDPFAHAVPAVFIAFEAWYDPGEDNFLHKTFFKKAEGANRDDCVSVGRSDKRQIGFLIYRDFRGLTRPITLAPTMLFGRLLTSQDVVPRNFETALGQLRGVLKPMTDEPDFASMLNAYKAELERVLSLSLSDPSALSFELSDGTRQSIKEMAQLYVRDEIPLPLQRMGAGTRSLAILAILTLIMRRRQRGILALEEPETFLFPHAQRRIVDECLTLADQTFVTTHSPYVLERIPIEGVGRVSRQQDGSLGWHPLSTASVKQLNLYSRRLRHSFCEALLGRGVVIAEGESDRWWLNCASRALSGKMWNGERREALELHGIAVISAEANGDIPKVANFFLGAGLPVACVVDRLAVDDPLVAEICALDCLSIFLHQAGLEELLSEQIPVPVLRELLTDAPYSRTPLLERTTVSKFGDSEVRSEAKSMLAANKGSSALHEWLQEKLDETSLPRTLAELFVMITERLTIAPASGAVSLLP